MFHLIHKYCQFPGFHHSEIETQSKRYSKGVFKQPHLKHSVSTDVGFLPRALSNCQNNSSKLQCFSITKQVGLSSFAKLQNHQFPLNYGGSKTVFFLFLRFLLTRMHFGGLMRRWLSNEATAKRCTQTNQRKATNRMRRSYNVICCKKGNNSLLCVVHPH